MDADAAILRQPPAPARDARRRPSPQRPSEVRYARSGEASIAYAVVGEGDVDLVFVPGFVSHLELLWEDPATARFFRRLASFARVIMYDKREQGLSDRFGRPPTFDESLADLDAVLDAAGVRRAALVGISEGGPVTLSYAATRPERVSAVVAYGTFARLVSGPGYDAGVAPEMLDGFEREILRDWGTALSLQLFAPSLAEDRAFSAWWSRLLRQGTSPRGAASLFEWHRRTDIRDFLPRIAAPTLVLHRRGDRTIPFASGRYVAEHVPGARLVPLPGDDHLWMADEQDELLDEIEEHVTGRRIDRAPERSVQTLLLTDIADSTRRAEELGDRRWRDLLARYEECVARQLRRHGGRLVKHLGDGTLAAFDQPAGAVRCASELVRDVEDLGLALRAGLHTGECAVRDGDVLGLAVHIGARVGALAQPGEVLVSSTVKELVAGSGLRFAARGQHELRGVEGSWTLFAVCDEHAEVSA